MRKTKIEIIDETVEFYSKNPRAIRYTSCQYQMADGRQCAHSRCLTDEARQSVVDNGLNNSSASTVIECSMERDNIHKEEYRGHESDFWNSIQNIHDVSSNWSKAGLSVAGRNFVEALKQKYS